MSKKTMVLGLIIGAFLTGLALIFTMESRADLSDAIYAHDTFSYEIFVEDYFEPALGERIEAGIAVALNPDLDPGNPSRFSEAYLDAAQHHVLSLVDLEDNSRVDALVVFNKPLSSEQTNTLLQLVDAHVFESGSVGIEYTGGQYVDGGKPWAAYSIEEGPLLTAQIPADALGYMAVRVWMPTTNLSSLLEHEDIAFVDTTPQYVRDELSSNPDWQDFEILSVAIEMPVWGYDWQ